MIAPLSRLVGIRYKNIIDVMNKAYGTHKSKQD